MTHTERAATELTLHLLQNPNDTDTDAYDLIARLCPRGAHDLTALTLHLAEAVSTLLEEQAGDRSVAIAALQQHTDATKTRVHHNPNGWTLAALSPDPQECTTNHQPGPDTCPDPAVWKVVELHDHGATLSFWCDTHLPAQHQPAA